MILACREVSLFRGMQILFVFLVTPQALSTQAADKPHYKASRSESGLVVTGQLNELASEPVGVKMLDNSSAQTINSSSTSLNRSTVPPKPVKRAQAASSRHVLDNSSAGKQYRLETTLDDRVKVYQYQDENGVAVFTDHAPGASEYQVILYDCYACRPDSDLDWKKMPLYSKRFDDLIQLAARNHQLEPALIRAVIHAESAFNVYAISKTGAMGLMQLMPETAKELGVKNAFKPAQNIDGGARYLAKMLKRFDGDIELACAAYNAGPTRVTEHKGIPPYPETIAYVERVKILLKRYQSLG
ncbi:lytic transglycosylase domain-containing protein [Shewanella woodyi]|uniref:lytic transglycosylase domain-containing protein n=1 Tax=Shewanella woodyi TaxID=60961 RepID=UPI0007F88C3D|nr:lytic transglycosylase domain-containing protein [Shewanella woodyi]